MDERFGKGGVEVGAAAVAAGMADQLGSLRDAITLAHLIHCIAGIR